MRDKAKRMIDENGAAFDFTSKDINGNEFTLSSLRGKWVVLDFWGSWCGPCIKEIPHIKEIWKRYGFSWFCNSFICRTNQ